MNKKLIATLAAVGIVTTLGTTAYAGSTSYSFTHTGYGAPQQKNFTLSSSAYVTVQGSQSATTSGVNSVCYYSMYKQVDFWIDEEIIAPFSQTGNKSVGFSASSKLAAGNYYLEVVCNTPSKTTGTISW